MNTTAPVIALDHPAALDAARVGRKAANLAAARAAGLPVAPGVVLTARLVVRRHRRPPSRSGASSPMTAPGRWSCGRPRPGATAALGRGHRRHRGGHRRPRRRRHAGGDRARCGATQRDHAGPRAAARAGDVARRAVRRRRRRGWRAPPARRRRRADGHRCPVDRRARPHRPGARRPVGPATSSAPRRPPGPAGPHRRKGRRRVQQPARHRVGHRRRRASAADAGAPGRAPARRHPAGATTSRRRAGSSSARPPDASGTANTPTTVGRPGHHGPGRHDRGGCDGVDEGTGRGRHRRRERDRAGAGRAARRGRARPRDRRRPGRRPGGGDRAAAGPRGRRAARARRRQQGGRGPGAWPEQTIDHFGAVHVVCNNAGVAARRRSVVRPDQLVGVGHGRQLLGRRPRLPGVPPPPRRRRWAHRQHGLDRRPVPRVRSELRRVEARASWRSASSSTTR